MSTRDKKFKVMAPYSGERSILEKYPEFVPTRRHHLRLPRHRTSRSSIVSRSSSATCTCADCGTARLGCVGRTAASVDPVFAGQYTAHVLPVQHHGGLPEHGAHARFLKLILIFQPDGSWGTAASLSFKARRLSPHFPRCPVRRTSGRVL